VSLEPDAKRLIFKDTGKGIASKDLPFVFDRFYTQTPHGTGIGLAFCQDVLKRFGGSIVCDSVEGEYTIFTLSFPSQSQI
jgi:signal transduction histidine kinase